MYVERDLFVCSLHEDSFISVLCIINSEKGGRGFINLMFNLYGAYSHKIINGYLQGQDMIMGQGDNVVKFVRCP